MNNELVIKLKKLNQKFYSQVAVEFDKTREKPWSGWYKVEELLKERSKDVTSCLDIACGNGRFGTFLSTFSPKARYVGIDFSTELIIAAEKRLSKTDLKFELFNEDVLGSWDKNIHEKFDIVVLFGILHHIPGIENRKRIFEVASSKLNEGGILVATAWQIPLFRRFENKMLSADFIKQELDIDVSEFEKNDFILDWKRGPVGYRYSHYSDPQELIELSKNCDLKLIDSFDADGRTDNINRYYVYVRP